MLDHRYRKKTSFCIYVLDNCAYQYNVVTYSIAKLQ